MKERVIHVDVAKGLSIALVAMFHSEMYYFFYDIIKPMALFRMPLFFFLSGIFFAYSENARTFIARKSEALLKPYFVVLFAILFMSFLRGESALAWQFKGIIYGSGQTIRWVPLWFLTHLFLVYIFAYFLFHALGFSKRTTTYKLMILTSFIVIGTLGIDSFWLIRLDLLGHSVEVPGLPFSADLLLITSFYFISGYLSRKLVVAFKPNFFYLLVSAVLFFGIGIYTAAHIDLNMRVYTSPIFATIAAFSGIYIVVSVSWFIGKAEFLSYIPSRLGKQVYSF